MKSKQRGIGGIEVLVLTALWFGGVAIAHKPDAAKKAEAPQPQQTEQVAQK